MVIVLKFGNIHAGKEWLETIQFQFFQHILDQLSEASHDRLLK